MKTPIKHPSIWILICALSVLLASLGSAISAESPNNQDTDTLMKESPKYDDSAALPDDISIQLKLNLPFVPAVISSG
ncbi:MAG: hypothetical protein ACLQPD_12590 [Desulfomonilaceae bacterium]